MGEILHYNHTITRFGQRRSFGGSGGIPESGDWGLGRREKASDRDVGAVAWGGGSRPLLFGHWDLVIGSSLLLLDVSSLGQVHQGWK